MHSRTLFPVVMLLTSACAQVPATGDNLESSTPRAAAIALQPQAAAQPEDAAVDPTAPLGQQAAYIQAVVNNGAYIGTSSSVRLNEFSVTYNVPTATARRLLRVSSLAVTLAGRNLALWSSYAGKDPNVDTSGLFGEVTSDNGLGTPQPRQWALRFNLGL